MGVEYSRYLVPSIASFSPAPAKLAELIESLTTRGWLPRRESSSLESVLYAMTDEIERTISDQPAARFPFSLLPWNQRRTHETIYVQRPMQKTSPDIDAAFLQQQFETGGLLLQYSIANLDLDAGVRYPLAKLEYDNANAYYSLRFWLSPDYVYVTSESLEGFDSLECECGKRLAHEKRRDVFYPHEHFPLICPSCRSIFDPNTRLFHLRCGFTGVTSTIAGGTTFRFCIEIDCGKCVPDADVPFNTEFRNDYSRVLGCDFIEIGSVT